MRNFKIVAFLWITCFLILEAFLRIYLVGLSDFFLPKKGLIRKFYPWTAILLETDIKKEPSNYNVLILGGSVVSPGCTALDQRLDTLLSPYVPQGTKLRLFNQAVPAHTSLDNLIK